jgi:hypothetical protein
MWQNFWNVMVLGEVPYFILGNRRTLRRRFTSSEQSFFSSRHYEFLFSSSRDYAAGYAVSISAFTDTNNGLLQIAILPKVWQIP